MKKLLLFIAALILILAYQTNGFLIATSKMNGGYSVYKKREAVESEYELSLKQAFLKRLERGEIEGESIRFIGTEKDIMYLINKLNVVIVEQKEFSNIKVIYGYSSCLGEPVKISNRNVNIQFAKRGSSITIGTPLIVGSY